MSPAPTPESQNCPACAGTGYSPNSDVWIPHPCGKCHGSGKIRANDDLPSTEKSAEPEAEKEHLTPVTDAEAFVMKRVPVRVGANGVSFTDAEVVPSWLSRQLERELAEAKAEIAATHEAGVLHAEESLGHQEQAGRLAGALMRYRMPCIKDDAASRAEFGELTVSRELEAREALAAWKQRKQ